MIINIARYRWVEIRNKQYYLSVRGGFWFKGIFYNDEGACEKLASLISVFLLSYSGKSNIGFFENLMNRLDGNFSVVYEDDKFTFAAVDRIRAFPVYYVNNIEYVGISNCARALRDHFKLETVDEIGLLEFNMAGYVTGRDTLYSELKQLQAGEFLIYFNDTKTITNHRYYRYYPKVDELRSENNYFQELDDVLNSIFFKLMKKIKLKPVWVPLSGGLDSRLVVVKLLEHGCKNIQTFSYGVKGNHEAVIAKQVAKELGVPWVFVQADSKNAMELYNSKVRKKYASFADGLNTLPKYLDFEALHHLHNTKVIPADAVIINGQSGDFITGGHIPSGLIKQPIFSEMFDYVIKKHFSLWSHLLTNENIVIIKEKFKCQFPDNDLDNMSDIDEACAIYECWEWQERQSKGIVNAQRVYEYFGYSWELPLWDVELMNFYCKQKVENRLNQNLFIGYLTEYNPGEAFKRLRESASTWAGHKSWIIWTVGQIIHFFSNRKNKDKFYNQMNYFGAYHNQYALFGMNYYFENYKKARSVTSFAVKNWLKENKLRFIE